MPSRKNISCLQREGKVFWLHYRGKDIEKVSEETARHALARLGLTWVWSLSKHTFGESSLERWRDPQVAGLERRSAPMISLLWKKVPANDRKGTHRLSVLSMLTLDTVAHKGRQNNSLTTTGVLLPLLFSLPVLEVPTAFQLSSILCVHQQDTRRQKFSSSWRVWDCWSDRQ